MLFIRDYFQFIISYEVMISNVDKVCLVLVRFASLVVPEDSSVGLATLLALVKPEVNEQCFSCLPLTLVTLQLAVYFCALLQVLQQCPEAFLWSPDQVSCMFIHWISGDFCKFRVQTTKLNCIQSILDSRSAFNSFPQLRCW